MADDSLVEVARFQFVSEANLAKAYLQEHDIPFVVVDDHSVLIDPFPGVKLRVPGEYADRAQTLIRHYEPGANSEIDPEIWPEPPKTWPRVSAICGGLVSVIAITGVLLGQWTFPAAWVWIVVGSLSWALGKYYWEK